MFSPVKAVGVGALAIALGGVLLVARSPGPQSSVVHGTASGHERAAPVEVRGELVRTCGGGPGVDPAFREYIDGVMRARGGYCYGLTYRWSDPRLDGTIYDATNEDLYVDEPEECDLRHGPCPGIMVLARAITIENANGAWRMRPLVFVSADYPADVDGPDWRIDPFGATWVLEGEGANDGLVAVIRVDATGAASGVIIDGDLPPLPAAVDPLP
jgi:hypothetical protein